MHLVISRSLCPWPAPPTNGCFVLLCRSKDGTLDTLPAIHLIFQAVETCCAAQANRPPNSVSDGLYPRLIPRTLLEQTMTLNSRIICGLQFLPISRYLVAYLLTVTQSLRSPESPNDSTTSSPIMSPAQTLDTPSDFKDYHSTTSKRQHVEIPYSKNSICRHIANAGIIRHIDQVAAVIFEDTESSLVFVLGLLA